MHNAGGVLIPLSSENHISVKEIKKVEIIERLVNRTEENGEKITFPDMMFSIISEFQVFNDTEIEEFGNSHFNILVNQEKEIIAFTTKNPIPALFPEIFELEHLRFLNIQVKNQIISNYIPRKVLFFLETLSIEGINTWVLTDFSFLENFPQLKNLSISILSHNPIKIPHLHNLRFLSIHGSSVELQGMKFLESLHLSKVHHIYVKNPEKFKNLKEIVLKNIELKEQLNWIKSLPKLKTLKVIGCKGDIQLIMNQKIQILALDDLDLKTFNCPQNVTHLYIRNCKLKQINNFPKSIKSIDLCQNELTEFPNISHLNELRDLNLEKNRIKNIPDDIQIPNSLHFLNLKQNPLKRPTKKTYTKLNKIRLCILPAVFE